MKRGKISLIAVLALALMCAVILAACGDGRKKVTDSVQKDLSTEVDLTTLPNAGGLIQTDFSVTDPDSDAVALTSVRLWLSKIGNYTVRYAVEKSDYTITIEVADRSGPVISLFSPLNYGIIGTRYQIPELKVMDNSGDEISYTKSVSLGGEPVTVAENGTFLVESYDDYLLTVTATDAAEHESKESFSIKVMPKDTLYLFNTETVGSVAAREGAVVSYGTDAAFIKESGGYMKITTLDKGLIWPYVDFGAVNLTDELALDIEYIYFYVYNDSDYEVRLVFNQDTPNATVRFFEPKEWTLVVLDKLDIQSILKGSSGYSLKFNFMNHIREEYVEPPAVTPTYETHLYMNEAKILYKGDEVPEFIPSVNISGGGKVSEDGGEIILEFRPEIGAGSAHNVIFRHPDLAGKVGANISFDICAEYVDLESGKIVSPYDGSELAASVSGSTPDNISFNFMTDKDAIVLRFEDFYLGDKIIISNFTVIELSPEELFAALETYVDALDEFDFLAADYLAITTLFDAAETDLESATDNDEKLQIIIAANDAIRAVESLTVKYGTPPINKSNDNIDIVKHTSEKDDTTFGTADGKSIYFRTGDGWSPLVFAIPDELKGNSLLNITFSTFIRNSTEPYGQRRIGVYPDAAKIFVADIERNEWVRISIPLLPVIDNWAIGLLFHEVFGDVFIDNIVFSLPSDADYAAAKQAELAVELNEYADGKGEANYSSLNWQTLIGYVSTFEGATFATVEAVEAAFNTAKTNIDSVAVNTPEDRLAELKAELDELITTGEATDYAAMTAAIEKAETDFPSIQTDAKWAVIATLNDSLNKLGTAPSGVRVAPPNWGGEAKECAYSGAYDSDGDGKSIRFEENDTFTIFAIYIDDPGANTHYTLSFSLYIDSAAVPSASPELKWRILHGNHELNIIYYTAETLTTGWNDIEITLTPIGWELALVLQNFNTNSDEILYFDNIIFAPTTPELELEKIEAKLTTLDEEAEGDYAAMFAAVEKAKTDFETIGTEAKWEVITTLNDSLNKLGTAPSGFDARETDWSGTNPKSEYSAKYDSDSDGKSIHVADIGGLSAVAFYIGDPSDNTHYILSFDLYIEAESIGSVCRILGCR